MQASQDFLILFQIDNKFLRDIDFIYYYPVMKHRYRFLFMGIVILILIISQQIQITTPINQHPENNQSSITGQRFDTITGILLT